MATSFDSTRLDSTRLDSIRISDTGSGSWSVAAGSLSNGTLRGVAISVEDSVYAVGDFETAIDVGPSNLITTGDTDALLLSLTADQGPANWAQGGGRTRHLRDEPDV